MQSKIIIITLALFSSLIFYQKKAAAPDDITTNQRAWYDAVDLNANNNYTDNPNKNQPYRNGGINQAMQTMHLPQAIDTLATVTIP
jgi:hypothetical protein